MDTKQFVREPEVAVIDLGLTPEAEPGKSLVNVALDLKQCKQNLKQLKQDKASVARAFKSVEQGSPEHSDLVANMQRVSAEYRALEDGIKAREKSLRAELADFTVQQEPDPPFYRVDRKSTYAGTYVIRELEDEEWEAWLAFTGRQLNVPAYCTAPWFEVMERAFGNPTRIWVAIDGNGNILGGIPLTFFNSRLFGRFAVATPYFNYGAIITPYFDVLKSMLGHLKHVRETQNLNHIEVRTMQPDLGPSFVSKKVSMVLGLPDNEEQLDQSLGAKVRAQSKKAQTFQPNVQFGGLELLEEFYRVFAINMRDLGTPVYAKHWFKELLAHPGIDSTLVVVRVGDKAVSAGFLVGHNGMLEIPWASTIKTANAMDTNMWMYRQILDFAVRQGYKFFDFGRSTKDSGTYRFKKQWGAKPYEHFWYYVMPEGETLPGLNPDNPKFRMVIAVWQRLPVWLTKILGPPIVRNIP